jgi:sn-glycerol 3-phosphate transport system permease protein
MVERTPILNGLCHAILLVGVAFVLVPLYLAYVAGSLTIEQVQQVPLPWVPGNEFMENLGAAWTKGHFQRLFINSFIVAGGITIGKIAVSLLSAFAITYFRFPFRMTAFWLIFVSLMLPIEVRISPTYESVANAALPLQWIADAMHLEVHLEWNLVNTYPGLILPLLASASATFLFRQFFLTVPDELCEAARLDGASPMHFFWTVLLPLSRSNMVALAIILFLYGWNQYLWPLLFTTEADMGTAVIGLAHLIPRSDSQPAWNVAMAAALLTMLPPVIVVAVLQRSFVKGLVDSSK